ncbi:hypothetical protein GQR36_21740 [Enterococcus termitis]
MVIQKRLAPMIAYEYLSDTPLTFLDIVSYKNRQGKTKTIVGIDTWREEAFVWRGKGLLRILKSNWSILALTKTILVIRFEPTLLHQQVSMYWYAKMPQSIIQNN